MVNVGLRGRVALVTGATQGVGRRAARLFAAEGAWIAVNYFADNHGAKSLIDEIRSEGGRAMLMPGSARDAEGAWRMARHVELDWAQIDILVHAAELLDGEESIPDINPLLRELAPAMQSRGWGRVITFSTAPVQARQFLAGQFPAVLANAIFFSGRVAAAQTRDRLDDAAARLALFLGSAWNPCIADQTFLIDGCGYKEVPHDAR